MDPFKDQGLSHSSVTSYLLQYQDLSRRAKDGSSIPHSHRHLELVTPIPGSITHIHWINGFVERRLLLHTPHANSNTPGPFEQPQSLPVCCWIDPSDCGINKLSVIWPSRAK